LFYLLLSIILAIALTLNGTNMSLDLILDDTEIRTDTGFGWSLIIVWIVHAFLCIPILMVIVQRARQILDYVLTFHLLHLLCVWHAADHFPTRFSWWILQIITVAIMTFGGEWACMHREMKPIMISSGNRATTTTTTTATNSDQQPLQQADEDEVDMRGSSSILPKRKTSDAQVMEDEEPDAQEGALLAAVGKAKKALMQSAGQSRSSKRNGKQKYDQIPMTDIMNEDDIGSMHSGSISSSHNK
jgi:hypothetical protein